MSKTTDKITVVNSANKQRYNELFSLMNEINHTNLNTKGKFKNLILSQESSMLIILVLIVLYVVAYWRNWTPTFFILISLMIIFEALSGYVVLGFIKKAKGLQDKLANQSEELTIQKTHISLSRKQPIFESDLKKEDIRAIYITRYNILIMPLAHAESDAIYLDKANISDIRPALEADYGDLIKEIK